jgi:uncharacterized HAD superfamily protein
MAKSTVDKWLTSDGLLRIQGWARDGLTNEQIAKNMGIALTTFKDWRNKHPSFATVLKETKDKADREVENALYKSALEGNTTAQIFWLKNRKYKDWRDKTETAVTVDRPYTGLSLDELDSLKESLDEALSTSK